MKILIISPYWHPHIGGVENVAKEQATRLVNRGHAVSVLTASNVGWSLTKPMPNLIIESIKSWDLFTRFGIPYPIFHPGILRALNRNISQNDVMIVHDSLYLNSLLAVWAGKRQNIRMVLIQHSPKIDYPAPWNLLKKVVDSTVANYTIRNSTVVASVSNHSKWFIKKLLPYKDVVLLPNGVDVNRFSAPASNHIKKKMKSHLGVPADASIVLTVRRLVPRNGVEYLIRVAEQMKDNREIVFVIVGDGPERLQLENLSLKLGLSNVIFLGKISEELLPNVYRSADVFVLPTLTGEGFGLVVLEAFASGLPVITFPGGGPDDLINDGENGLFVARSSPITMAKVIHELLHDRTLMHNMSNSARETAESFDWDEHIMTLERLLY